MCVLTIFKYFITLFYNGSYPNSESLTVILALVTLTEVPKTLKSAEIVTPPHPMRDCEEIDQRKKRDFVGVFQLDLEGY